MTLRRDLQAIALVALATFIIVGVPTLAIVSGWTESVHIFDR